MKFYVGVHQPSDAKNLGAVFVSANRLCGPKARKADFSGEWIMDSGAFTILNRFGRYPEPVEAYAAIIERWRGRGLVAAVSQDYMCEPFVLAKTGLTLAEHQRLTIERFTALQACETGVEIIPVLQGYAPAEYVDHVRQYGPLLRHGARVGVGSICKRNGDPGSVLAVLEAIKAVRPDLRLHGFGLKTTSLQNPAIRAALHSADSMAWSYAARRQGRSQNDWREAEAFVLQLEAA